MIAVFGAFTVLVLAVLLLLLARRVDRLQAGVVTLHHQLVTLRLRYEAAHDGRPWQQRMDAAIACWYDEACRRQEGA